MIKQAMVILALTSCGTPNNVIKVPSNFGPEDMIWICVCEDTERCAKDEPRVTKQVTLEDFIRSYVDRADYERGKC